MDIEAQIDRLEQLRQKLEGCESLEMRSVSSASSTPPPRS
jgi:hypothetical protein